MFDKILLIVADENIRLERLMKRNKLTKNEALARMNAQIKQEEKIIKSDYIIYNNTSIEDLSRQVEALPLFNT